MWSHGSVTVSAEFKRHTTHSFFGSRYSFFGKRRLKLSTLVLFADFAATNKARIKICFVRFLRLLCLDVVRFVVNKVGVHTRVGIEENFSLVVGSFSCSDCAVRGSVATLPSTQEEFPDQFNLPAKARPLQRSATLCSISGLLHIE